MTPDQLKLYLHQHIPLSEAMAVSVDRITPESVVLRAPLAPNINHRATVFGGSASAVAILSAWSLLHTGLSSAGIDCRLVIQRNTMEYTLPITGEFTARSTLQQPGEWQKFLRTLARMGKARITVAATLEQNGQPAGHFTGEFVALAQANVNPPNG